ncbi:MAG: desulfoferrodoxin [Candidatus Aenigmatarchaeota archaeon]
MVHKREIYKCYVCGNVVEVVHAAAGQLVCCGKPMERMEENTVDASVEKHVPVLERAAGGVKVAVGLVAHPMEDKHYIEWIEVVAGDKIHRKYMKPGEKPEAVFETKVAASEAREYCNLHGLWKS